MKTKDKTKVALFRGIVLKDVKSALAKSKELGGDQARLEVTDKDIYVGDGNWKISWKSVTDVHFIMPDSEHGDFLGMEDSVERGDVNDSDDNGNHRDQSGIDVTNAMGFRLDAKKYILTAEGVMDRRTLQLMRFVHARWQKILRKQQKRIEEEERRERQEQRDERQRRQDRMMSSRGLYQSKQSRKMNHFLNANRQNMEINRQHVENWEDAEDDVAIVPDDAHAEVDEKAAEEGSDASHAVADIDVTQTNSSGDNESNKKAADDSLIVSTKHVNDGGDDGGNDDDDDDDEHEFMGDDELDASPSDLLKANEHDGSSTRGAQTAETSDAPSTPDRKQLKKKNKKKRGSSADGEPDGDKPKRRRRLVRNRGRISDDTDEDDDEDAHLFDSPPMTTPQRGQRIVSPFTGTRLFQNDDDDEDDDNDNEDEDNHEGVVVHGVHGVRDDATATHTHNEDHNIEGQRTSNETISKNEPTAASKPEAKRSAKATSKLNRKSKSKSTKDAEINVKKTNKSSARDTGTALASLGAKEGQSKGQKSIMNYFGTPKTIARPKLQPKPMNLLPTVCTNGNRQDGTHTCDHLLVSSTEPTDETEATDDTSDTTQEHGEPQDHAGQQEQELQQKTRSHHPFFAPRSTVGKPQISTNDVDDKSDLSDTSQEADHEQGVVNELTLQASDGESSDEISDFEEINLDPNHGTGGEDTGNHLGGISASDADDQINDDDNGDHDEDATETPNFDEAIDGDSVGGSSGRSTVASGTHSLISMLSGQLRQSSLSSAPPFSDAGSSRTTSANASPQRSVHHSSPSRYDMPSIHGESTAANDDGDDDHDHGLDNHDGGNSNGNGNNSSDHHDHEENDDTVGPEDPVANRKRTSTMFSRPSQPSSALGTIKNRFKRPRIARGKPIATPKASRAINFNPADTCRRVLGDDRNDEVDNEHQTQPEQFRHTQEPTKSKTRKLARQPRNNSVSRYLSPTSRSPVRDSLHTVFASRPQLETIISRWRGLANFGNACYMNASMQMLCSLSPFAKSLEVCSTKVHKQFPVASQVSMVMKRLEVPFSRTTATCRQLKAALDKKTDKFRGYLQRDAHEFVDELLDQIHEELSPKKKQEDEVGNDGSDNGNGGSNEEKNDGAKSAQEQAPSQTNDAIIASKTVDDHFRLDIEVCLTCTCCGFHRTKEETYRYLSIDIADDDDSESDATTMEPNARLQRSVKECLARFFQPEEREINCEKCEEGKTALQTMKVLSRPKALLLHLKRFGIVERHIPSLHGPSSMQYVVQKNKSAIRLTSQLSLDPFRDATEDNKGYYIRSIVHHEGSTANSGHYTADAVREDEDGDMQWVSFDDGRVHKSSPEHILRDASKQKTAYMLLYSLFDD